MFQARQFLDSGAASGLPIQDKSTVNKYVNKWSQLLEGIEEELPAFSTPNHAEYVKAVAAIMLESQMNSMLRMNEDTRALSVGPFMKYVFPIIRRAAIRLVATSIASVQPMMGPVGGVAFYRPRYASDKGSVVAGTEMNKSFNKWYSSDFIDGESVFTSNAAVLNVGYRLKWARVKPGTVSLKVGSTVIATDNGAGSFTNLAGMLSGGSGTINYTTGDIALTLGSAGTSGDVIKAEYRYDNEANSRLPEVQLDIEVLQIKAESRKLKSLASVEAADDLRALWGRDIDSDLVATMADEMSAEIDREIVGTALSAVEDPAKVVWDRSTPTGVSDPEHLKSLVIRMSRASQIIHRRTQRGAANWAICSSEIAALLDTMEGFQSVDDGHVYQGGISKGGILSKKWAIYVDPVFPINKILMGYQGPSILDTGLIYSPYVPMEITPNFVNPQDFTLSRAVRTRHKVTLARPEFFAEVAVTNLA